MRNNTSANSTLTQQRGVHTRPAWTLILPLLLLNIFAFMAISFSQSANLDQIRNGALGIYPTTPAADWVNGNAGPSNAHFAEGYSIPYRVRIADLIGDANTEHILFIEWDTKQSNGHAIDYITYFQNLDNPTGSHMATFGHGPEVIDPTLGTSFSGAPILVQIPTPSSLGSEVSGQPTTSFNNLPAASYTGNPNITKMAIWGGTIVSLTYDFEDAPDATTGSTQTRLKIVFKASDGKTALIAWAGHIAAEYDWGQGRGATGVSGSPYHTRIISIDGKPGNQDRSLKATAVIIPPPLCGLDPGKYACPETPSLTFNATGSSTGPGISYEWTLVNGTPSAGAKISGSNTGYSVTVVPIGSTFLAGGTFKMKLIVMKTGADPTLCEQSTPSTIVNVVATAGASPTTIDITSAAHSTTLTGGIGAASTFTNVADYTYLWEIVTPGTHGSLTNTTSRIATYTAGLLDAGATIQFRVTATQIAAPNCTDVETVSISVSTVGNCDVSAQTAVCQGSVTTHNGSPNPKPANATYVWSLEGYGGVGSTTSTLASTNGGVSMQVNANSSYRIVLTQTYLNTALNTSCYEDVVVEPTPTVATQYIAPADCADRYFEVKVTNPVVGHSYSIDQPGNSLDFSSQNVVYASGDLIFTGLVPGDGYKVTVTTDGPACTAYDECAAAAAPTQAKEPVTTAAAVKEQPVATAGSEAPKEAVQQKIVLGNAGKVAAAPNPFTTKVRFSFTSMISGHGTLDVYNSVGQKVATVYQGYLQAGREMIREYQAPTNQKGTFVYVFRVGDQQITGKLIAQ